MREIKSEKSVEDAKIREIVEDIRELIDFRIFRKRLEENGRKKMKRELCELSFDERLEMVQRITEVMRDEYGISENSISEFWQMLITALHAKNGSIEK